MQCSFRWLLLIIDTKLAPLLSKLILISRFQS